MSLSYPSACIAFEGARRIAQGAPANVAAETKRVVDGGQHGPILIFDALTSHLLEFDLRGTAEDVAARVAQATPAQAPDMPDAPDGEPPPAASDAPRTRGRPKLGVVAREVTLLPRHWAWLATQPGGASVALRKLVEEARRTHASQDAVRLAREAAYRFMSAIASAQASFEEASRALFAGDRTRFEAWVNDWPIDVREHVLGLAKAAFASA